MGVQLMISDENQASALAWLPHKAPCAKPDIRQVVAKTGLRLLV